MKSIPVLLLLISLLVAPAVAQNERPAPTEYHHEDDPDRRPDGAGTGLDAADIEYEFFRCMETVFEYRAAVACQQTAAEQYERAIRDLAVELRTFMTPTQREAFDAAQRTWERHFEAERQFLRVYWSEVDREWGEPMRTEAILNLYRMRYDALDHIPRG